MVEMIVTLVLEVVKCLAPPAGRQLGYLRHYNGNFENLKAEVEKLKDELTSIQQRVSEGKRNGEEIEEKVEKWLHSAKKVIDDATEFIADEETTNKRCLKGLCPNLRSRYQLSKKAKTETKVIVELREEAGRFDRVSYRTIPEEIWLKSHKGYEAFESRLSTLKAIQNALTDPNVSIVGLYGMGGIGKTTLVKEVTRQVKEDKLFDQVVFSEVSQTPEVKKIQGEIGEKLGLVLHEEAESRRASRLYERLKNEKKILVVLDNMWKYVDLETVGIPLGYDHKGCKVLLTARDLNVLLSMGSKDNFSIGVLNGKEAWRLFKMMAVDDVESCQLKSTATDVAKACGGLPIALTTIARALRNKSVPEWKNALRELRTPSTMSFEGVSAEAYSTVELSYKYLKGKQLKKTFLLCSLMSNPISIKDLLKYGMGLGIFQGVYRMEDAHNKLYALVHELKDSCLLIEVVGSNWFYMHDVVRDAAISIGFREQHAFSVRNEYVWEWPDEDALKKCSAISLINCNIHELPEGLECPQLEFIYINSNESFAEINIPKNFFNGMRKLRVVDLTRMQLFSLPSSIEFQVNLQTLCLDQSILGDIGIIGKLKNLEVLSLLKSDIVKLPDEIGQLTKLKLLDLTDCFKLKFIAPNVISCLTRLEELYMGNCIVEWEQVEGLNCERSNASLNELMHLPRLATLEIDVKDDNFLPDEFFTIKLERFKMSIGDGLFKHHVPIFGDWFQNSRPHFLIANHENLRTLKLKLNSKSICSKKLQGIKNVEYLCLDKLHGVKNVLFDLDTEGFLQLKHLHVQNNPDFLCIADSLERIPCDAFPLLESFTLYNLINLEKICIDGLKVESFKKLRTIKVENCDKLSNVFLLSTTKSLSRLERIAAINCNNMEEILTIEGGVDADNNNVIEKIEFAQLRYLSLGNLPKLTSFCCEVKTPSASPNRQQLQEELTAITLSNEISLEDMPDTSTQFFNEKIVLPNLEVLELHEINVEKIWHNQLPAMFPRFQNLTQLIVWNCQKLKYLFSASMIRSFGQLQHLEICGCRALQEIISHDGADQVTHCFLFPQMITLKLIALPELRHLYPEMHTSEWPALKKLVASSCNKIKIFTSELFRRNDERNQLRIQTQQPLFLFEKIIPNLEELSLSGKDITEIWQAEFPQHLFRSLIYLEVTEDDSAGFPVGLLERLHNLEYLQLGFSSYKEILSNEGYLEKHVDVGIKSLHLTCLNHLKYLWKQDSKLDSIFQRLEILRVYYCQNLLTLLPSSSESFRNLTELQVFNCNDLIYLVTSSTAQCLARLVSMKVFGCGAMKQVVVAKGDSDAAAKKEIVFSKLKTLSLIDLESLTSFCSANYTFKFPSLREFFVTGCPMMKFFTTGDLGTQHIVDIRYGEGEDERRWDGDINTTIQQLHQDKLLEECSSYYSAAYNIF